MQALQPCSDTNCECEKRCTSPVSSCNQLQHTLQAAPHVKSTKTILFSSRNWPLLSQNQTSKEVHHAGIAALLGHQLRMWETVYVSSLILWPTSTHTPSSTTCQVNKSNHVLKQKTGLVCRKIKHLRRSIMQALQPCSDTNCECEKRFTSPVSSCNQLQHTLQAAPHVKSTKAIMFSSRKLAAFAAKSDI